MSNNRPLNTHPKMVEQYFVSDHGEEVDGLMKGMESRRGIDTAKQKNRTVQVKWKLGSQDAIRRKGQPSHMTMILHMCGGKEGEQQKRMICGLRWPVHGERVWTSVVTATNGSEEGVETNFFCRCARGGSNTRIAGFQQRYRRSR